MQNVERHSTERRIGRGALWALAGRGLGVLATALMVAALPRFLTKEQYGAFSLIMILAMFASIIGTLGLNDGCVRLLAEAAALRNGTRLRYVLRTSLFLTAGLATITGLVGSAWLVTQNQNIVALTTPTWLFFTVLGMVVLLALQLVTAESLRGLHDIRFASVMSGGGSGGPLATLLFVGIVSVLYFSSPGANQSAARQISLTQVLLSFSLALLVTLPVCLVLLRRARTRALTEIGESNENLVAPQLRDMTSVSIPLMFCHLLVFFTMNADLWILEAFCDLEKVGLYAAARRIMLAVSVPGQIAAQATMSSIPDLAVRGQLRSLETMLRRSALISALLSFAIGLVLLARPEFVLAIVCDKAYAAAAPVLVILCLGNLVVVLCGNAIHALTMTGHHFYGLIVYAIAAAALAIGGPFAAQAHGEVGVALVASGCVAVQSVVSWWLAKRYVGVWTHPGWPTNLAGTGELKTSPTAT